MRTCSVCFRRVPDEKFSLEQERCLDRSACLKRAAKDATRRLSSAKPSMSEQEFRMAYDRAPKLGDR